MNRHRAAAPFAALLAALVVASCGSGNGSSGSSPSVLVYNAASTAPIDYDVLVNNVTVATNLAYEQYTPLQAVATGGTTVDFETPSTTTVDYSTTFAAVNGYNYTVLLHQGSSAITTLTAALKNAPVSGGQAQLGFVGAAPTGGTFDFYITAPSATLPATPSVPAVAYAGDGASVTAGTITFASGAYRIRAVATGDTTQAVVFDSGSVNIASQANLLLAVMPATGSAATFSLLAVGADGTVSQIQDERVQVRMGNFSPNAAGVDGYLIPTPTSGITGTPFVSDLTPDTAGAYQVRYPGGYQVGFTPTGYTTTLLAPSDVSLGASSATSIFLAGIEGASSANNQQLQVVGTTDDLSAPPYGMARLRVAQFAPDMNNAAEVTQCANSVNNTATTPNCVDVMLINGSGAITTVPALVFPGVSGYIALRPGTYTVEVVPSGVQTPVLATGTVSPQAGSSQTVVIYGCEFPGSGVCGGAPSATLSIGTF